MLTRWEVEGQLRSLHPRQQHARRVRRTHVRARRRARVTIGVLLGIGLIAAMGAAWTRAASVPAVATLQDSEWGAEHVGSYHTRARPPLFPTAKRPRWDSYAARAQAARDRVTGARPQKLARY
jgi:hypothetical protein